MNDYKMHSVPTIPTINVTGAALRAVQAADERGRATHQALIDVQIRMTKHDQIPNEQWDAVWCARSVELADEQNAAIDAIDALPGRWRKETHNVRQLLKGSNSVSWAWKLHRDQYAKTLSDAGVPLVIACQTAEAWRDAAARGC
jgi:hypothetical protein